VDQPTPTPHPRRAADVVCVYVGPYGECPECGGGRPEPPVRADSFCGDDCAADFADRAARDTAEVAARRALEDDFADQVAALRAAGHTDEECDRLLAHIRT
jgi:hypothetical protein